LQYLPRDSFGNLLYAQVEAIRWSFRNMAEHEHEHGSMDVTEQQKAFAGFIRMVTWGACISVGILIFMALANG
jgi:CHASE3 domain sensor protein